MRSWNYEGNMLQTYFAKDKFLSTWRLPQSFISVNIHQHHRLFFKCPCWHKFHCFDVLVDFLPGGNFFLLMCQAVRELFRSCDHASMKCSVTTVRGNH